MSKNVVVSFKVDEDVADFLKNIPNKSMFIRSAVLSMGKKLCPLCVGEGYIVNNYHIQKFFSKHEISTCNTCHGPDIHELPTNVHKGDSQ